MKYHLKRWIAVAAGFIVSLATARTLTGCERIGDDIQEIFPPESEDGTPPPTVISVKKIAAGIDTSCQFDGRNYAGQGFAECLGIGYRLYDTGLCQTYDLSDLESPRKIASFALASRGSKNHSNCAQFGLDEDGNPLLYVSGLSGKCYVERISSEESSLVQVVTLPALEVFNISQTMNIICGDDGFLWAFGSALFENALTFAKLKKPLLSEGDVTLSGLDVIDFWTEENYVYSQSVWQGGMVYGGLLYFVFGTTKSKRHIVIYDTKTHQKVSDIDLNSIVREEPEDCDLVDGQIVLTVNGGSGYYLIDLKEFL